jgi:hypothetical protein
LHDHDQRFKTLIQEFFAEFLELFFAKWADRLDCSKVEWLDKEVFPDPPDGSRNVLDLVGKVPSLVEIPGGAEASWLALVHMEIESPETTTPIRARMHRYYTFLREKYRLPVLPIVLFLKVGLSGIGIDVYEESFWELDALRFKYLYVGLPGLDAVKYVRGDNWLGVALAALMSTPNDQVAALGAEALGRIKGAPLSDQQRFLLGECVEAYLPLDAEQQRVFEKLAVSEKQYGVEVVNKTSFEKGIEKGIEKGEEKGRRAALREVLEAKFGALPETIELRLQAMSLSELKDLARALLKAQSLADLGLDQ